VKKLLEGQAPDPVRAAKLQSSLKSSEDGIKSGIRQAWCIAVATAEDDSVKAFKVTLDDTKTLFQSVKDDKDLRIQDTALDPDLLLPGGSYDLWREDEPEQRVKTIVGAFFERSALPKMLRRQELLDTVANGALQGRFVLRLKRPDGSFRTWWREHPEESALNDANLEAVQLANAALDSLASRLLHPGTLPGLQFGAGVKAADLLAYFSGGHILTVKQSVGGIEYDETVAVPQCAEAKVQEAAAAAVKAGLLWVTNGPMSFCGEDPAAGAIAKAAVLRSPPEPIVLTALTPEELPDGWSDGTATALSLQTAISAKVAPPGVTLPWSTAFRAINDALNSRFLEVVPGGPVSWPCEAQSAAAVEFRLPAAGTGSGGNGAAVPTGFGEKPQENVAIAQASLGGAALVALADAMADVQATVAAYGTTLIFKVSVEAKGLPPEGRKALRSELAKAVVEFVEAG
jgi:hypothetical protein